MKALVTAEAANGYPDGSLLNRTKAPLSELVLTLKALEADEILIAGPSALKERLRDWHERELKALSVPVTLRFYDCARPLPDEDSLLWLIHRECLCAPVLLISPGGRVRPDLIRDIEKAIDLYPHLPLMGVRKPDHPPARGAISLGERNRVTRFSLQADRRRNGWEPAGMYYFPERFLSDGIPAFLKSKSPSSGAFESFVSWSIRNFKVYAHVFAAHLGQ